MTDEEKKAIKNIKKEFEKNHILPDIANEDLGTLLNLIKKQSKEIEEYKKQLDLDYVDKHFVPIERYNQLEKEIEELKDKNKKLQDKAKELIFEKQELTSALLDSTPNDKIKAKIEEVEQWELYNMKIPRLSTLDERLGAKIGIKYVLQSLLEEKE